MEVNPISQRKTRHRAKFDVEESKLPAYRRLQWIHYGIALFFICMVLSPFALYFYGKLTHTTESVYKVICGITLPSDLKRLDNQSTRDFHGDGERHSVYLLPQKENAHNRFANFHSDPNQEIEEICLDIISSLDVKPEYFPDFETPYCWKKYTKSQDILVIVYFPEKATLHFFQELS